VLVRAPEPIFGARIGAPPADLNGISSEGAPVLRFAPDEAFVLADTALDAEGAPGISEMEYGFVGWWLSKDELAEILHHVEWAVPDTRPVLRQGLVAGVPARLWLAEDRSLLLVHAAYAHELVARLP
jgi:hypothetical protein